MFSDLTKASYTNYLCSSALDLHGPAINAYRPIRFLLAPSNISFKISFRAQYIYACELYNTGFR